MSVISAVRVLKVSSRREEKQFCVHLKVAIELSI
jgi:hypothetical protein